MGIKLSKRPGIVKSSKYLGATSGLQALPGTRSNAARHIDRTEPIGRKLHVTAVGRGVQGRLLANAADEIRSLEEQRCRALVKADWGALAALVADAVVHVYANGLARDE